MGKSNKWNIGVAILLLAVCLFGLHYGVEKVFNLLLQRFQARFFWGCLLKVFCCSCCSCCCCSCVWNTILWQIKYTNEACTSTRMHIHTHTHTHTPLYTHAACAAQHATKICLKLPRLACVKHLSPVNVMARLCMCVGVCVWDGNCCALCVCDCVHVCVLIFILNCCSFSRAREK